MRWKPKEYVRILTGGPYFLLTPIGNDPYHQNNWASASAFSDNAVTNLFRWMMSMLPCILDANNETQNPKKKAWNIQIDSPLSGYISNELSWYLFIRRGTDECNYLLKLLPYPTRVATVSLRISCCEILRMKCRRSIHPTPFWGWDFYFTHWIMYYVYYNANDNMHTQEKCGV